MCKQKFNYHTHTVYCDGQNTCEELVIKAIEKGFDTLGFSGHSYTFFDERYCMSKENTQLYKKEVNKLKEKYCGKINILCGVEQDYYSLEPVDDYDFVIGSVHYVLKNGEYIDVDSSKEMLVKNVNRLWNGDFYAFAKDYYETVSDVVNKTHADIIGHFDLITKFNEDNSLFDPFNEKYLSYSKKAVDILAKTNALFEINTGAMAKGYTKTPYPSEQILQMILNDGGKFVYSSDCHDKEKLDFFPFSQISQNQIPQIYYNLFFLCSDGNI